MNHCIYNFITRVNEILKKRQYSRFLIGLKLYVIAGNTRPYFPPSNSYGKMVVNVNKTSWKEVTILFSRVYLVTVPIFVKFRIPLFLALLKWAKYDRCQ